MPGKRRPNIKHRFGAHMSIAGGLHLAFERAAEAGCDCLQVFVKNQRQWVAPSMTEEQVAAWKEARNATGITPTVAHATYLINLASPDTGNRKRSVDAFTDELRRCEALGIMGLVVHPGAHLGEGETAGTRRIARALNEIHRRTSGFVTRTLLEITAGQGSALGYRFEHLANIIGLSRQPERIGFCFDTCHAFAAGYDLATGQGYTDAMGQLETVLGLERLACFHMNDSKTPLGSRVDRHEHIGKGRIGRSAFKRLVTDPRFIGVPMLLETPKGIDEKGRDLDRRNLATLRRMTGQPA